MSILRYICTSFLKWNLVFIMFIVIWYKNHSHLLGKWASVLLPSCSFCLLSKTPTGERLNCSNNDSFHSSLFTWYSLLFVCTAHTPQPELHFRFLAYLHMHTWIFKEECWVFRLERMLSYIMQLLANCICTTGKDFPPRRAHHPFVPRSRVSPDSSSLRALSTVQRGSPLEVLFFFLLFPRVILGVSAIQHWQLCCVHWDMTRWRLQQHEIRSPQCTLAAGGVLTLHSLWDDLLATLKILTRHLVQCLALTCRFLHTLSHWILVSAQGYNYYNVLISLVGMRGLSPREIKRLDHIVT